MLASPQIQKEIDHVMEVYSEKPEVQKKVWESDGFKTKAVSYYAKWVALYSICGKYLQQIATAHPKRPIPVNSGESDL